MNWYIALPLVAFVLEFGLGVIALQRDLRSSLHRIFAFFLFGMSLWSLAIFGMRSSPDLERAYVWERLVMAIFPVIGVAFFHFTLQFSGLRVRKITLVSIYLIAIAFMALGSTPLVVKGMQLKFYGYAPVLGPLFFPYIAYPHLLTFMGLANLIKTYRHASSADDRNRAGYIIASMAVLFLGATSDYLPVLGSPNYPMGVLGNIVFALLTAVAVLKYHLLDIRMVFRKGLAYTIVSAIAIATYLTILLVATQIGRVRELPLPGRIAVILGIAILFQPLLRLAQQRVDRWFYRERLGHLRALEQFSQEMQSVMELDRLASSLVKRVRPALGISSASVFLPSPSESAFVVVASEGLKAHPSGSLRSDGSLARWLAHHGGFLFRRDIEVNPYLQALSSQERHFLEEMDAEAIVGLRARERLVGILMLGPKASGEVYGDDDLKLATVVSRQVAIAFDNAELYLGSRWAYEQLKETQAKLVQAERLRALGEMASGVTHDFNNLLAAVLGRAQLAMEYANDEKVKADLQVIQQAALDGADTVKRLQDFARVRVDRESNLVDPNQVVETALSFIEPRRREREETGQVAFNLVLSLGQVGHVCGASGELRQVLTNIMLNAMDAMPQGGTLSVTTQQQDGMAVIAIADTGAGIPPEIQGKVFDPFFTTKGPRGTGLGLSVAYGIVLRHGGAIDLVSTVGKGSTFYVRLPLASTPAPATAQPASHNGVQVMASAEPKAAPASGPADILVIDDDPAVAEVLRLLLQQKGYQVAVAASGEDGLAAFRGGEYRLVIADLGLPKMSGKAVATEVKKTRPDTPVVLITGWGVQLDPKEMARAGVAIVISKPFVKEDIYRCVAQLLGTSG